MERASDWSRVVLDAGPFFRFGSAGHLLDLVAYLGTKAAISREVETELQRNARRDEYAFLRALEHLQPPVEVIDLSSRSAEELLDRTRAARKPGDHPDMHKGEISTVLLAFELGEALVVCDDSLGKRLSKTKMVPRLSTAQLAAEMVVANALSREAGTRVFVVSAGGADPKHFENTLKQARRGQVGSD
ncbi:MAG: hypothetical protein ABSB96_03975 [Gaiellaceae bacterium]